jgi:hypothetical protein
VLEVPISAYVKSSNARTHRFAPNRRSDERLAALKGLNKAGVPLVTYILHSNSLMNAYEDEIGDRAGFLGPDEAMVASFSEEMGAIAGDPDFQFISSSEELWSLRAELASSPAASREIFRI